MALVHSRIRRVVYCKPNPVNGGLGTHYRIHILSSTNHRFRAFTSHKLQQHATRLLDGKEEEGEEGHGDGGSGASCLAGHIASGSGSGMSHAGGC